MHKYYAFLLCISDHMYSTPIIMIIEKSYETYLLFLFDIAQYSKGHENINGVALFVVSSFYHNST